MLTAASGTGGRSTLGAAAAAPRPAAAPPLLLLARRRRRLPLPPPPRAASSSSPAAGDDGATRPDPGFSSSSPPPPKKGPLAAVRRFFGLEGGERKKLDRAAIAKLGAGGFLSYGFISNVNYGVAIGVSWIAFVKKYGVCPIGDKWPAFLAFYAGMWTIQNFARPARFALAVALAPSANRLIDRVGEATGLGRRWGFGILLAAMAVTMTTALGLSLWALGGFPPAPAAGVVVGK